MRVMKNTDMNVYIYGGTKGGSRFTSTEFIMFGDAP